MNNSKAYNAPLNECDTLTETRGCRHSSPDNCAKNSLDRVCAFVREDGMCVSPPKSWVNHFHKLKQQDHGLPGGPQGAVQDSTVEGI